MKKQNLNLNRWKPVSFAAVKALLKLPIFGLRQGSGTDFYVKEGSKYGGITLIEYRLITEMHQYYETNN